jgi:hypothetical protein
MWSWRSLIPLMLGLDLLACAAPAPSVDSLPASASNPEALILQGNTARENKGYAEAMRLYRQAADMGDAAAMDNIGYLYQKGLGCRIGLRRGHALVPPGGRPGQRHGDEQYRGLLRRRSGRPEGPWHGCSLVPPGGGSGLS